MSSTSDGFHAETIWLDASNFLNAQLDFRWLDLSDESHFGSDAVLISQDDGATWTEIYSLTDGSSESWSDVSVDLGAYLQPTTDDFLIAFQQYDNFSAPLDGVAIDDIVVTEVITAAQPDLSESFESGRFSTAWSKSVTNDGRVQVTSDYAYDGTYGILLDDDLNGGSYSTAAATLHMDGSGLNSTDMMLSFRWLDLSDEYDAGLDGVFVSDDAGSSWHEVYAFDFGSPDAWSLGVVDLGAAAAAHGLNLAGDFQIKFQQHDNYSAPTDGIAIDYVKVFEV